MRSIYLGLMAVVLVAAACSSSDDESAPSAANTTVPVTTQQTSTTAAPTTTDATSTTSTAPVTTTTKPHDEINEVAVGIETADGLLLEGVLFGDGATGVVLAHMRPADMESWFEFARLLAGEGYVALAFNFRGYGASEGTGFDVATDIEAAFDLMMEHTSAESVFVIGASMGGTGAVAASATRDVAGTITLSAPVAFEGADAVAAAPQLTEPVLLVVAENDQPYADHAGLISAAATGTTTEVVPLEGSQHGTDLFKDHDERLTELILTFIEENQQTDNG